MPEYTQVLVRPVSPGDRDAWARLRRALWPDFDPPEIDGFLANGTFDGFDHCAVFVAEAAGDIVGFAEASARPYAEGCRSTPVAYLEGWYVAPDWRRKGVGKALVDAVEEWGRRSGYAEIASDAAIDNAGSIKAHGRLGFAEEERIVCFRKAL